MWRVLIFPVLFVSASIADASELTTTIAKMRYCLTMQKEVHLPSGGYVDCLDPTYAIELEWAEDWYSAVGQSLYYAQETSREPAIILLCPASAEDTHGEGLCRSYLYRLEAALRKGNLRIKVWECFPQDKSLDTCLEPGFDFSVQ